MWDTPLYDVGAAPTLDVPGQEGARRALNTLAREELDLAAVQRVARRVAQSTPGLGIALPDPRTGHEAADCCMRFANLEELAPAHLRRRWRESPVWRFEWRGGCTCGREL